MGVPVGVRANLALALARGAYDVVHGFEPGPAEPLVPRAARRARRWPRDLPLPRAARVPAGPSQRDRLLGRVDALLATSPSVAEAAAERFPGDYRVVPAGVDIDLLPARREAQAGRRRVAARRARARARGRSARCASSPDWELVAPADEAALAAARRSRAARAAACTCARARRAARAPAARTRRRSSSRRRPGSPRCGSRPRAAGCAIADPPGVAEQPELGSRRRGAARRGRRRSASARPHGARAAAEGQSFDRRRATSWTSSTASLGARRRRTRAARPTRSPTATGSSVDLHMHTRWSHDCSIEPAELSTTPRRSGLGAIAVTDHNVFGGALETVELARDRDLIVIPGEEVKTDGQGEVIGLFLSEEIPRGMSFADTIAAIQEQGGLVYLPHPFDRMHAIPDPATLHRHLADIDVFEVYNARLLFEALQRRGAALRAQVQPARGRRLRRARPPGRRHGRAPHAALRRPRGVPALASGRREVLRRPEVARLPPVASSGWRRPRKVRVGAERA